MRAIREKSATFVADMVALPSGEKALKGHEKGMGCESPTVPAAVIPAPLAMRVAIAVEQRVFAISHWFSNELGRPRENWDKSEDLPYTNILALYTCGITGR